MILSFHPEHIRIWALLLTEKWQVLSPKGQNDKVVSLARVSTEELRRLYESDVPVLAVEFSRSAVKDCAPPHSDVRGQLFALNRGWLIGAAPGGRGMLPSQRCARDPPKCVHA